jgi:hypothetical protein
MWRYVNSNIISDDVFSFNLLVDKFELVIDQRAKYESAKLNTCSIASIVAIDISWKSRFVRSSARGAGFDTKHASNANVVRVVLLDTNWYLPLSLAFIFSVAWDNNTVIETNVPMQALANNDHFKCYFIMIKSKKRLIKAICLLSRSITFASNSHRQVTLG